MMFGILKQYCIYVKRGRDKNPAPFFNPISYEKPDTKECYFKRYLLHYKCYSLHKLHIQKRSMFNKIV